MPLPVASGVEAIRPVLPGTTGPPPPPPPPPPTGNVITVGANLFLADSRVGWTSVHNQRRDATTKAMLGTAGAIANQHLEGFGSAIDVEVQITGASLTSNVVTLNVSEAYGWKVGHSIVVSGRGSPFDGTWTITGISGAPSSNPNAPKVITYARTAANTTSAGTAGVARNWEFMDSTYGFPSASSGYFSAVAERCITFCGCPAYMRNRKAGTAVDPIGAPTGTELTSLTVYQPPHSSYFPEFGALAAAFMSRYTWVKYLQVWNEGKGFYISTQASGSSLVPPGSGLPAGPAGGNRHWIEGYTAMFNAIFTQVKAARPDAMIGGPYFVIRSYSWDTSSDWANDPFPYNLQGPWGYADKKALATFVYFIPNCAGCDLILSDIKNLTQDFTSGSYYSLPSVPGAPDLSNRWLQNPDNGNHHHFYLEGQVVGAWNMDKQAAFTAWIRSLGASSPIYQRPQCDARTVPIAYAEWYAYPQRTEFKGANPRTGDYWANDPISQQTDETAAFAWMYRGTLLSKTYYAMAWKPEGTIQGGENDPSDSNPLGLWNQYLQAGSLNPTLLKPVCDRLVADFPPGTQLVDVASNIPEVRGIASPTKLMLASRSPTPVTLTLDDQGKSIDNTVITLSGYEVRFITR